MRYLFLALVLIGSLTSAAAQQTTTAELVPPPETDYFPERWKEFRSEGLIRILFPKKPRQSISRLSSPAGELQIRSISYESFISYNVMTVQYPADVEKQSSKSFMDTLRDGSLAAVSRGKPKLISESDFTLDGHPGRFLHVEFANDTVARFKWIAVGDRVYILHVTTPKGREGAVGAENDYDKIAMSFMDSFALLESAQRKR